MRIIVTSACALAVFWSLFGCRKQTFPTQTFMPKGKEFQCEFPADWEVSSTEQDEEPAARTGSKPCFFGICTSTGGPATDSAALGEKPDEVPVHIADLFSPDKFHELSAYLQVTRWPKQTRQSLEEEVASQRRDKDRHMVEPLTYVRIGQFQGFSYSYAYLMNAAWGMAHREKPPPLSVLYKTTYVHFDTPGGGYAIIFAAPVPLYDKHRPEFEHLLKTFRWLKQEGGTS